MLLGTDFTLNWLGGVAFGRRIGRDSPNFVTRIYYRVWASTDPNVRADQPDGPTAILAPWVTMVCVINALVKLLIVGMLQDQTPYLVPAAFAFLLRAVIKMIYGSQLIWGPARLRGVPLASPAAGHRLTPCLRLGKVLLEPAPGHRRLSVRDTRKGRARP